LKEEEEEIKRLREIAVFKASKIRKFKNVEGLSVTEKILTVPVAPILHTSQRAQLKEDTL
jgi:hypothetical protein